MMPRMILVLFGGLGCKGIVLLGTLYFLLDSIF